MFKKILNLYKWISNLFKTDRRINSTDQKINFEDLGVIRDPRSREEKEGDYLAEEITFSFPPIEWNEKSESEWRKFPIFHQNGSSSCVGQAIAKALGIENFIEEGKFVHFSARDIYTKRSNYPGKGMFFQNGMNIGHKIGATFEQLMPSQALNEGLMNDSSDRTPLTEIAAKIGRGGNYVVLPFDIDAVASVIEHQEKGVVIGVRFGPNEWDRDVPQVLGDNRNYGHLICATNAILYEGKKALVIEDSWGKTKGINGRKILTQDWFDANKITYAGYFKPLNNDGLPVTQLKPQHIFRVDLSYGMRSNPEVVKLQEVLAYFKFFPSNVDFTGNFYSITLKAVKLYQESRGITPTRGLVGPLTRAKLNEEVGY